MTAIAPHAPRLSAAPAAAAPRQVQPPKNLQAHALNSPNPTGGAAALGLDKNDSDQEAMDWNQLQNLEQKMLANRANVTGLKASAQGKSGLLGEVRHSTTKELRAAAFKEFGEAEVKELELDAKDRLAHWKLAYMPANELKDKGNLNDQLEVEKARVFAVALGDDKSLASAADVAAAAEINRRIGANGSPLPKQDRPAILADADCYHTSIAKLTVAAEKAKADAKSPKSEGPSLRDRAFATGDF